MKQPVKSLEIARQLKETFDRFLLSHDPHNGAISFERQARGMKRGAFIATTAALAVAPALPKALEAKPLLTLSSKYEGTFPNRYTAEQLVAFGRKIIEAHIRAGLIESGYVGSVDVEAQTVNFHAKYPVIVVRTVVNFASAERLA